MWEPTVYLKEETNGWYLMVRTGQYEFEVVLFVPRG